MSINLPNGGQQSLKYVQSYSKKVRSKCKLHITLYLASNT